MSTLNSHPFPAISSQVFAPLSPETLAQSSTHSREVRGGVLSPETLAQSSPRSGGVRGGLLFVVLPLVLLLLLSSCTDDESFSTSTSDGLTFAVDKVCMDTVFSTIPAPTKSFWVFNRSDDGIRCPRVFLEKGNQTGFRVNVDGEFLAPESGYAVQDVEIRKGDSIRVFVEMTSKLQGTLTPNEVNDNIVFALQSGRVQKVPLQAWSWDAEILRNLEVKEDYTLSSDLPMLVYGGIKVDSLATLTIPPGATLFFQQGSALEAYGTVRSMGTAEQPVVMRGSRLDNMFDYLPYDMVSGQWDGVRLHSSSVGNEFYYTDIHSTFNGIVCDSSALDMTKLTLHNSTIHNCQGFGLQAKHSVIDLQASQITNALYDCVWVDGGFTRLINCTLAQYYPFDQNGNRGWALKVTDESNADNAVSAEGFNGLYCVNTLVTGYADDVLLQTCTNTDNLFYARYANCVLRTPEVNDSICTDIVWEKRMETDAAYRPEQGNRKTGTGMFRLVNYDTQHYDFHLDEQACAVGLADSTMLPQADRDGNPFTPTKPEIGCYSLSTSQNTATKSFLRLKRN